MVRPVEVIRSDSVDVGVAVVNSHFKEESVKADGWILEDVEAAIQIWRRSETVVPVSAKSSVAQV
jgi:hypothetical protein